VGRSRHVPFVGPGPHQTLAALAYAVEQHAGLLHDTIEKTSTEAADLRRRFGVHVASLVVALSEDPAISGYSARKAALRDQVGAAGDEALMVFAADKVSKARELRMAPASWRSWRWPAPPSSSAPA
jgi:(p)ppGpp synthase/HD superfamily hydrolase